MTDSRHYAHLSAAGALRWSPGTFSKAGGELSRIHGTHERIRIADFACGLVTYEELLQKFGGYGGYAASSSPGQQQQHQQQQQQQKEL
jgi:acetylornithine deacetylase/succinyl-diaminopimelate desuccinylase-like protein